MRPTKWMISSSDGTTEQVKDAASQLSSVARAIPTPTETPRQRLERGFQPIPQPRDELNAVDNRVWTDLCRAVRIQSRRCGGGACLRGLLCDVRRPLSARWTHR